MASKALFIPHRRSPHQATRSRQAGTRQRRSGVAPAGTHHGATNGRTRCIRNVQRGLVECGGQSLGVASHMHQAQLRLVHVAGDAQTLAAALNQSALNIANAAGATIGGAVVGAGWGYSAPALAGAGLAAAGCLVWAATMWDKKRLARHS